MRLFMSWVGFSFLFFFNSTCNSLTRTLHNHWCNGPITNRQSQARKVEFRIETGCGPETTKPVVVLPGFKLTWMTSATYLPQLASCFDSASPLLPLSLSPFLSFIRGFFLVCFFSSRGICVEQHFHSTHFEHRWKDYERGHGVCLLSAVILIQWWIFWIDLQRCKQESVLRTCAQWVSRLLAIEQFQGCCFMCQTHARICFYCCCMLFYKW